MIALSFVELFFGFAGTETMYFLQNIVVELSLQSHGYVKNMESLLLLNVKSVFCLLVAPEMCCSGHGEGFGGNGP
jgi:hypothetical protein